jgi:lipid A 3-O-deacylase
MLRSFVIVALFLAVSIAWGASFCLAESDAPSPNAREILKRGTIELGGIVGFWQALDFPFEGSSANRSAVFIKPRIGVVVTDEIPAGLLTGNLEVLVEPFFARFTQPFSAEAAGGTLVFKYNLLSFGRWMPFWDAGAGMLWTNLAPRIAEQSTPLNVIFETGPGVQYFMTTQTTLTFGIRYSHISNAGTGDRNIGLNAVLPYAGLSWFIP